MVSRRTVFAARATDRCYGTSFHSRNAPAAGLGYLQATLWVPYALIFNSKERGFKFELPYGNATATLRWNHVFSPKVFMNVSAIYNDYDFQVDGGQDVFKLKIFSGVRDYNAKLDFDWFANVNHT